MRSMRTSGLLRGGLIIAITASALAMSAGLASGKPPSHAKAYGKYCQGESKKHVAGEKGTPFSQCVTAMAKLDSGAASTPTEACKGLSHKHVKGAQGTPFSKCVAGGAKLVNDKESSGSDEDAAGQGSD
jgi:hypothetical protein